MRPATHIHLVPMLRVGVAVPFVSPTTFPDGVDSDSFAITFV